MDAEPVAGRRCQDRSGLAAWWSGCFAVALLATVTGTHGARLHRPDLRGWEHEVWVDCMHLDGPFLAQLALVPGEEHWADLAASLLLSHARVLQLDRNGLFSHGF